MIERITQPWEWDLRLHIPEMVQSLVVIEWTMVTEYESEVNREAEFKRIQPPVSGDIRRFPWCGEVIYWHSQATPINNLALFGYTKMAMLSNHQGPPLLWMNCPMERVPAFQASYVSSVLCLHSGNTWALCVSVWSCLNSAHLTYVHIFKRKFAHKECVFKVTQRHALQAQSRS